MTYNYIGLEGLKIISPDELLIVKHNGQTMGITLRQLYMMVDKVEEYKNGIYYKSISDFYVKDAGNQWTKISTIYRGANKSQMSFTIQENGISNVTTKNHDMLTDEGSVSAIDTSNAFMRSTFMYRIFDETLDKINDIINNIRLAYVYGILIQRGIVEHDRIRVLELEEEVQQYIGRIFEIEDIDYKYTNHLKEILMLPCEKTNEFIRLLKWGSLPENFVHYNKKLIQTILSGVIDGDCFLIKNTRALNIKFPNRAYVNQFSLYLRHDGLFVLNDNPLVMQIRCTSCEKYILELSSHFMKKNYPPIASTDVFVFKRDFTYDTNNILLSKLIKEEYYDVYNIVTESGYFYCDNILEYSYGG